MERRGEGRGGGSEENSVGGNRCKRIGGELNPYSRKLIQTTTALTLPTQPLETSKRLCTVGVGS